MQCVVCTQHATASDSMRLGCSKQHVLHYTCGEGWIEMWRADGQPPSCPVCKHLTLNTPPSRTIDIYLDKTCSHCRDFDTAVGTTAGTDSAQLGFSRIVCMPCKETDTLFLHSFQTSAATGIREYIGSTMQTKLFCAKAGLLDAWHESIV